MDKIPAFSPDSAFFIIDSYNCDSATSHLYGYSILDRSIIQEQIEGGIGPGEMGAYVSVSVSGDAITVTQDFTGSFGLYLYRSGSYFALSNSFFHLVEYLQNNHPLSLDKSYLEQFLASDIVSFAVTKTAINEIELLWRNSVVEIDKKTRSLNIKLIDYKENTVSLDSPEGMATLDEWYYRWTGFISSIANDSHSIVMDLSGGMDSRLDLCLFLGSDIDMNRVSVNSIDDDLHTHEEDYLIANEIAKRFGFSLTTVYELFHIPKSANTRKMDISESLALSFYFKGLCHKQFLFQTNESRNNPVLYFGGDGGECLRGYWHMPIEAFIKKMSKYALQFGPEASPSILNSLKSFIYESLVSIQEKFDHFGRAVTGSDLVRNLFRESYCRYHFGRIALESYYSGKVKISPLLDQGIQSLKLYTEQCDDPQLLMTVIFDRYEKDLLDFGFDGGRTISSATIEYAKSLNRKYPVQSQKEQSIQADSRKTNLEVSSIAVEETQSIPNAPSFNSGNSSAIDSHLMRCYLADSVHKEIIDLFGDSVYFFALHDIENRKYFPYSFIYTLLPIAALQTMVSPAMPLKSMGLTDYLQLAEHQYVNTYRRLLKFRNLIAVKYNARIDVKCDGNSEGVTVLEKDDCSYIAIPEWFKKEGNSGFIAHNTSGYMCLKLKALKNTLLTFRLRGKSILGADGKQLPLYINYISLKKNGHELLREPVNASHNESFDINLAAKAEEVFLIEATWLPHDAKFD